MRGADLGDDKVHPQGFVDVDRQALNGQHERLTAQTVVVAVVGVGGVDYQSVTALQ